VISVCDILVQQYLERARAEFDQRWNEAPKVGKAIVLLFHALFVVSKFVAIVHTVRQTCNQHHIAVVKAKDV